MTRALLAPLGLALGLLGLLAPLSAVAAATEPDPTARGAVLWDPAGEAVLWEREASTPRPMASTTKIMTVLLALEAGTVEDAVTVTARAARQGGASLGLRAGQQVPMRSLLAGLILRSGNDAAVAVADHVAGSEEAFVARMNARAAELGLRATSFVNPSGLTDDANHHASPLDLARLTMVAMADPDFASWAGAERLTVPGLAPMVSRNELLGVYPGATGVKTGFTELSRYALVASAQRDGWELFAVVLGSEDNFGDAAALLDHGFNAFQRVRPLGPDQPAVRYRWAHGAVVDLVPAQGLGATAPREATATWRAILQPMAARPVEAGDQLGRAELFIDGRRTDTVPLLAVEDVAAPSVPSGPGAAAGGAVQEVVRAFLRAVPVERAASGQV